MKNASEVNTRKASELMSDPPGTYFKLDKEIQSEKWKVECAVLNSLIVSPFLFIPCMVFCPGAYKSIPVY